MDSHYNLTEIIWLGVPCKYLIRWGGMGGGGLKVLVRLGGMGGVGGGIYLSYMKWHNESR